MASPAGLTGCARPTYPWSKAGGYALGTLATWPENAGGGPSGSPNPLPYRREAGSRGLLNELTFARIKGLPRIAESRHRNPGLGLTGGSAAHHARKRRRAPQASAALRSLLGF
ncbi:hypothetical protein GCM10027294_12880 [Marinactinospora endophytica]